MIYKTIGGSSLFEFNTKCNELAQEGFIPLHSMSVLSIPIKTGGGFFNIVNNGPKMMMNSTKHKHK